MQHCRAVRAPAGAKDTSELYRNNSMKGYSTDAHGAGPCIINAGLQRPVMLPVNVKR